MKQLSIVALTALLGAVASQVEARAVHHEPTGGETVAAFGALGASISPWSPSSLLATGARLEAQRRRAVARGGHRIAVRAPRRGVRVDVRAGRRGYRIRSIPRSSVHISLGYGYGYGYGRYYGYPRYRYGYGYPFGYYGYAGAYEPRSYYGGPGRALGEVRLEIEPAGAQVFVDGYFVGIVDDFDGTFQRLRLERGPHEIEIRAEGYEPLSFQIRSVPGETIRYEGYLLPALP